MGARFEPTYKEWKPKIGRQVFPQALEGFEPTYKEWKLHRQILLRLS